MVAVSSKNLRILCSAQKDKLMKEPLRLQKDNLGAQKDKL
jgi:hypothetical protein